MKYAVIAIGGKQFIVEEGTEFHLERQEDLTSDVLFYKDDKETMVGTPSLSNVKVSLEKARDYTTKTTIGRFKSKSRYRRTKGHKQPMSVLKVSGIKVGKSAKGEDK